MSIVSADIRPELRDRPPVRHLNSSDFARDIPVLIVKMRPYVIHHGSVGIARSLGRVKVPVYAVSEDRFTPMALSRYVVDTFRWSDPKLRSESFRDDLLTMASQIGSRSVLIPTDDFAARFVAGHESELRSAFICPIVDPDLPELLSDKRKLHSLCMRVGVPCPETCFSHSIDDVKQFLENARFPVMIKAASFGGLPANVSSTRTAANAKEVLEIYSRLNETDIPNLLLQEYIPQGSEDWIFQGYRNPDTGCMISFTGRKLRSWPPFAGPTTLGVSQINETIAREAKALVEKIGYAGIMDLDYRLDVRDGKYKLLDFNPRIGANFRMFADQAEMDVVRAMHLDLTGRNVSFASPQQSRRLLVESFDFVASLSYIRRRALTWRAWWDSLQGVHELAWLQRDDLIPFFAMWLRLGARTLRGRLERLVQSFQSRRGVALRRA